VARERTLVILKPDAVSRGPVLVAEIIKRFTSTGFKIISFTGPIQATKENLDKHFPDTKQWVTDMGTRACGRVKDPIKTFGTNDPLEVGKLIIRNCRKYYQTGPLCALILERDDAIFFARQLLGSALPSKAEKGTIRGDLGTPEDHNSTAATRNLVHASDSVKDAEREIRAWFT
jgi:nucleoside-diphosphate kinase